MQTDKIYDIAVIGSGPAGMTAAIYAKRAELDTIVFDHDAPGGKVSKTAFVENYPGFKHIDGTELAMNMFDQMNSLGIEFKGFEVLEIAIDGDYKIIKTKKQDYKAKAVIIASGTQNRKLGIPGEDKYENRGVGYCAICDGTIYKGKPIAVVGGGNSAIEESIFLSDLVSDIQLVHRSPTFKADAIMVDEAKENKIINLRTDTTPLEIIGDGKKVTGLRVVDNKTKKEETIAVDGVFVFVGLIPKHVPITGGSIIDEKSGYNKVNADMETDLKGIFSAGDINTKRFRQISTAINDGAIAALSAKEYIKTNFKK